ncbi:TetR/AcrR family transcriptional regulator [Microbacterium sp. H1-D42]|uniref:TetR/AcrR family transcriptional regulator n=1 Tax=Microbacterium sp. H1-D42 TaxID=2925844 RepID=UPI001F537B9D|nr:TetR/AcrR family transcriptional regulator [Microbacterium sp. H1-D42]UNK70681.1 TetR/AcrR family transcriptional regulator [Microbacterium sp. H1-D42]
MPRPRSEKARQAVMSAMRRALAEDSYAAVTIEGLATEAGVSKQTIYRWWPSKAAVLGEALLEGELPGSDAVVPTTDDLAADLRAWFAGVSAGQGDMVGIEVARALIAVTATDPELGLVLNERLAAPIREWVKTRLRQAVADGDVREDVDADVVADHFIATASYAALLGQPLSEQRVDAVVQMVMRGIGARD